MHNIHIAIISLRYNDDKVIVKTLSREQFARMKQERKEGKRYVNDWLKRVTLKEGLQLIEQENRRQFKAEYDKAIMEKYNVPANYRDNRWFMEQVRPTI